MAAREILKWNFIDTSRVAVWGWSGGGSATLNLMFQYPDIYKTGIAIAAVANELTYDDILHYQNAEMLINALVKYNKQFQFMAYPNRTHSISEGQGTTLHLMTLYTNYLRAHCPPGAK